MLMCDVRVSLISADYCSFFFPATDRYSNNIITIGRICEECQKPGNVLILDGLSRSFSTGCDIESVELLYIFRDDIKHKCEAHHTLSGVTPGC